MSICNRELPIFVLTLTRLYPFRDEPSYVNSNGGDQVRSLSHIRTSITIFIAMCLVLVSCAGQSGSTRNTWQEQYDLGVRYLVEGNYEEAIIAFTAAIEIDPNRAEAYMGRGDAYDGSGETEENLTAALADYETAVALDETLVDAWLRLAEVYISRGDYDMALEVLYSGIESTGGVAEITERIQEVMSMQDGFYNSDEFVPMEEISVELYETITTYIAAFETGSPTTIFDYLSTGFPIENHRFPAAFGEATTNVLRTQLGIYKVELWDRSFGNSIAYRVEIRPENGIAYGADYSMNETGEPQTFYITGGCKDWNWNGEFESYSNDVNRSGAMIDCLNDGIITEENYFSSPSGELTMIQRLYEYGIGQEYIDPYGHHQLRSNNYQTSLFNTGGWTSIEDVKEDLWWN